MVDPSRAYLDYDQLTQFVHALAAKYPAHVRVGSLGQTPEGRELWLLTVGESPQLRRPAVWIDGNMHACELAGSSVALALAANLAAKLAASGASGATGDPGPSTSDLRTDDPLWAAARLPLFYILPRMSPDGAEQVLKTGRFIRSTPRDDRPTTMRPQWHHGDVDGDGLSLAMRVRDDGGDFVEVPGCPGLLAQRTLHDRGPFYRVYPEGTIEPWDGHHIPAVGFLDDNPIDLNRNFPSQWAPEHQQNGAGPFATSEPESRAVATFATAHPEIFAWFNYHCFGGVFIRPLGAAPDHKLQQDDLALYRQLGAWAESLTGYPMVSGYEEFLYAPEQPIRGDVSDYAFHVRGAVSFAIELWDLFATLGLPRPKKFVDYYNSLSRADLVKLYHWDREHNEGRCFPPWRPFVHPQLGAVEIGGLDTRHTIWNPPASRLAAMADAQFAMLQHVAALSPRLAFGPPSLGRHGDLTRVEVVVRNVGYLPTYVLETAKELDISSGLVAQFEAAGCSLVDPRQVTQEVGHLTGWGRGLDHGANMPPYMHSAGNAHERKLEVWVRGSGHVRVAVRSPRMGECSTSIAV